MINNISPKSKITIAMIIWGTISLFVREIQLESVSIAFFRAAIGSIFLLLVSVIIKDRIDKEVIRRT